MNNENLQVIEEFQKTISEFLQMISDTGDDIFNVKPSEKSWSVGQIADHANKTLSIVVKVLRAEGNIAERDPRALEPLLQSVFLNFETKYERPDYLIPGDEIDKAILSDHIKANIEKIKNLGTEQDLKIIPAGFTLPGMQEMTKLEWIYFAKYHTQRHMHQIQRTLKLVA